jgi:hypothetical protein
VFLFLFLFLFLYAKSGEVWIPYRYPILEMSLHSWVAFQELLYQWRVVERM